MKSTIYAVLFLSLAAPAFAVPAPISTPASRGTQHARKPAVKAKAEVAKEKEEEVPAAIKEINKLLADSRLKSKDGGEAKLEDFREDLALEAQKDTLTTDQLAKDRGLQADLPASAETELE